MVFQPGNPGRPKGSKNKRLELLRSNDVKLQKKVLDMAMEGDPSALKIIADRLWPRLRAQAETVSIDATSNDLAEKGRQIIDSALSGEITADVLRDLLTSLYAQGRLIELSEFEERVRALEERKDLLPWDKVYRPVKRLTDHKFPIRGKRRRSKNETRN